MLFADDAALVTHTMEELQQLIDRHSHACKEFGLTISINKTKVMAKALFHLHQSTLTMWHLTLLIASHI